MPMITYTHILQAHLLICIIIIIIIIIITMIIIIIIIRPVRTDCV